MMNIERQTDGTYIISGLSRAHLQGVSTAINLSEDSFDFEEEDNGFLEAEEVRTAIDNTLSREQPELW